MFTIIEEIIIKLNTRFLNKGTSEIHYKPEKELQLILGSNGYGKSSLLDEASPLPPDRKNYLKGGYKYIRIRHNNCVYILEADFKAGAKYSFKKEGSDENLNSGRTLTIQKQLVKEHFGYTQEIHDLLLGRVDFINMTASQRKEWIVKLCPSDTSFALVVLKEADRQINQIRATIKKSKEKLFKLQTDLVSDAELAEIKSSIDQRLEQIALLTPHVDNTSKWSLEQAAAMDRLEEQMRGCIFEMQKHARRINLTARKIPSEPGSVLPHVVEEMSDSDNKHLFGLKATMKLHLEEYSNLESMIQSMAKDGELSTADLEKRCGELQDLIAQLKPAETLSGVADPRRAQKEAVEVSSILDNILSRLPNNPNGELYAASVMRDLELKLTENHAALSKAKHYLDLAQRRKSTITEQHAVDCPKCNHSWKPGVECDELERVEKAITTYYKESMKLEEEIKKLQDARSAQDAYQNIFSEYLNLTRKHPDLYFIWDFCNEQNAIYESPKSLYGLSSKAVEDLEVCAQLKESQQELDTIRSALEQRKMSSSLNEQTLNDRLSYLEKEIDNITTEIKTVSERLSTLSISSDAYDGMHKESQKLEQLLNSHLRGTTLAYKAEKAELVAENMKSLQSSLAMLQERLNSNESKLNVCNTFEEMVSELSIELEQLRLVSDILSPFDGLVSEILNGFLSDMTGAMNGIASKVWTNKYFIHKCGIDKNGLNYKFPLTANDAQNQIPDISQGSQGEQEFAGFLFNMVARLYLKVNHYPLYLDEVGKMFTEEHRGRLYNYVKTLIEGKVIGQVLAVSHFESTHNSLVNADFNYIDPTGLSVPEGGNKTITVK